MITLNVLIFNEEENIVSLYEKLVPALVGTGRPWEIIFVNDGSTIEARPCWMAWRRKTFGWWLCTLDEIMGRQPQ